MNIPSGAPISFAVASLLFALATAPATGKGDPLAALPPAGSLVGRLVDESTRQPIGFATVLITELNRGEISHADGEFHFHDIPAGRYSLKITHLGYRTVVRQVSVPDQDTMAITIELTPTSLQGEGVIISSEQEKREAFEATEVLSGKKLQQQLGRTLAETIGAEGGVALRSMGPAPARPVIRGLGGDRLLILENGDRTGDLSATSADHAVTIDPLTAERVEFVQGPASLLYSSNALGGVVNLVRDEIATSLPDRVHGTGTLQGESVNSGYSGGLSLAIPAGPIALQLDGSGRRASDISTPAGTLRNTGIDSYNGTIAASLVRPWGYLGIAAGGYYSGYGIPGGFVGAHPNGVRVEIQKQRVEARSEYLPQSPWLRRVELHGGYNRYYHKELESNGSIGTEYGVLTTDAMATFHHGEAGILSRGAFSLWGEHRDFAAGGLTAIPPTRETSVAASIYEEAPFGPVTLQGGIRFEYRSTLPERTGESSIGEVKPRTFRNAAGSLALLYDIGSGLQAGVTAMRSFRPPSIEELFSEGPHLAAYSFDVGNPALDEETGYGAELSLRYSGERGHGHLALFRNAIDDYIYPRNTGDTSFRLPLPIYQYSGEDALMLGAELSGEAEVVRGVVVGGTVSYVEGTLRESGEPLPLIPPLNGRLSARYQNGGLTLGATVRASAAQNRLGEFETPTEGYIIYDAFAQYQYSLVSMLHTVVLSAENIADTEYRAHLSRVKSVMPEPGRNIRILYRIYF